MAKKSWREKFASKKPSFTKIPDKNFADVKAGEKMLIPSPQDMAETIAKLKPGTFIDASELRRLLAKKHDADVTCPVCNGIMLRIVCEAAYEAYLEGHSTNQITPFWRVVDVESPTARKLSFDSEFIKIQREAELLS